MKFSTLLLIVRRGLLWELAWRRQQLREFIYEFGPWTAWGGAALCFAGIFLNLDWLWAVGLAIQFFQLVFLEWLGPPTRQQLRQEYFDRLWHEAHAGSRARRRGRPP